ncbi:hypothetical protein VSH64_26435 [Amycolatopsis rhabdoformis]|uniref:Uncharacterized protein n=1 Tax=Amycolatopsis rhabdoformis TaxID=1448059 RepID=A0ABZ1HXW5_9PSEU|nr:hypothetical protein [Amycolatopsis rhabdoformis]WSE26418.1 hypothetical protein VSH64_26435 [Amycolatopsis rhabdoformis]
MSAWWLLVVGVMGWRGFGGRRLGLWPAGGAVVLGRLLTLVFRIRAGEAQDGACRTGCGSVVSR